MPTESSIELYNSEEVVEEIKENYDSALAVVKQNEWTYVSKDRDEAIVAIDNLSGFISGTVFVLKEVSASSWVLYAYRKYKESIRVAESTSIVEEINRLRDQVRENERVLDDVPVIGKGD